VRRRTEAKGTVNIDIQPLSQQFGHRLAAIIARAFHDYPPFRQYIHADLEGDSYRETMRTTFEYFVDLAYIAGNPVFGAWADKQLVGGMLIRTPKRSDGGTAAEFRHENYARSVDAKTYRRLEAFEAAMQENEPAVAGGSYYIDIVAADPAIQSKGIGRQLIEHVIRLSRDDPESIAVCLSTESLGNHGFYKYLGFDKVSSRAVGPITTTSFMINTPGPG